MPTYICESAIGIAYKLDIRTLFYDNISTNKQSVHRKQYWKFVSKGNG